MAISDNKLLRDAQDALRARLPRRWKTRLREQRSKGATPRPDALLDLRGPDGNVAQLVVEAKRTLTPRNVDQVRAQLEEMDPDGQFLVVAPYLSQATRERLVDLDLNYLDLTGNIRVAVERPALFIEAVGAEVNPDKEARASRTLRGGKAGRIVRMLIDRKEPPGVRELAESAKVNPGYVSRIMALLDREALIERKGHGRIIAVDWPRLLERWAEEAPLESRGATTMCLDPRGISNTVSSLEQSKLRYAVTGTRAVAGLAPVAEVRLLVVYVGSVDDALSKLGLRVAERGANVMLIEPDDEGVYEGCSQKDGLKVVALSQAAADLITSPGRGPAEAEALIDWMKNNEKVWRG